MKQSPRALTALGLTLAVLLGAQSHAEQSASGRDRVGRRLRHDLAAVQQTAPRGGGQTPSQAPSDRQPPQTPTFRTGINFVRVDVIVSDRNGEVVANLTQDDFEVSEDGKPQAIETFKLIRLDGGGVPAADGPPRPIRSEADEQLEAARDDVRLFAVFLDDYHVRRETSVSVRQPLATFIQTRLGPSDMLGVMHPLDPVSSVRMTRDHEAVVRAVARFTGRKYDYTPRNNIEEQYARYPAETVERIRNQVSLSAIEGLIVHMGSLKEGRKALVLVSEGFTSMLPPQLRDPVSWIPNPLTNPNRSNPTAGVNDPNEERAALSASSDLQRQLQEVYAAANRNNVAIYAVDPRGLPSSEFDISQPAVVPEIDQRYLTATIDTLRQLAEQTDGRALVNRNDLTAGVAGIVRDTSGYYLLGYNSTQTRSDGKFHEIKVRVRRPGVQVRARRGYWALNAEDAARALAANRSGPPRAVENALSTIAQPAAAHATIRTWIGAARGDNGQTKVTFVWEPVPGAAGDAARDAPARVLVTAVGSDGAPYFRGRVPDVASPSTPPAARAPASANSAVRAPSRITFDAPPGRLQLRLSVEGPSSQVIDSEAREITIPDLTSPGTMLGTPLVLRARTARDFLQLKGDAEAVPVATREFSRTDRLLVRVPAYGPGSAPAVLSAQLLNRAGRVITGLPTASSVAPGHQEVELPLAAFPPGEYVLEITATGENGDVRQELVGFRLTS